MPVLVRHDRRVGATVETADAIVFGRFADRTPIGPMSSVTATGRRTNIRNTYSIENRYDWPRWIVLSRYAAIPETDVTVDFTAPSGWTNECVFVVDREGRDVATRGQPSDGPTLPDIVPFDPPL